MQSSLLGYNSTERGRGRGAVHRGAGEGEGGAGEQRCGAHFSMMCLRTCFLSETSVRLRRVPTTVGAPTTKGRQHSVTSPERAAGSNGPVPPRS